MNRLFALLASALLAACSVTQVRVPTSAAGGQAVLAPNPNLFVQGIPPVPASIVDEVGRYTDFRGHAFVGWHPTQREMLVAHRKAGDNITQLYRLAAPGAALEQLTDANEPVRVASYEPTDGRYIVFERASGGNEATQVYRLDPADRRVTLLTDPNERHDMQGWLHRSSRLLVMSVALDRTAQGGSRGRIAQTLSLIDPAGAGSRRRIAELPGGGWDVGGVSWDDRQVALTRYLSAAESQVWLLDLESGKTTQVLPAPGSTDRTTFFAADFTRDNAALYVLSDRGSEFRQLMRYRFDDRQLTPISGHIPWDVDGVSASADGSLVAAAVNIEGRDELRLFDARTLAERPAPRVPDGTVGAVRFHRALPDLAFTVNSSSGPSQIHSVDAITGSIVQWTTAQSPPGIDPAGFSKETIVRWPSFDGRSISGLLTLPPPRFDGKRPVLIQIHGGPEGQAKIGFKGAYNYLIEELGIALIQPNVRGSSGFGKTFLTLDDGMKREDSVKDIGALLDWIKEQPDLDSDRVMIMGGSYGGYMTLACAFHYADRIASATSVVGISDFNTFLQRTESYRRDLRRVEYGDERDPAMRAFFERIAPLNNVDKITKPLFVIVGYNDPRVPWTEGEQIVNSLKARSRPVWFMMAKDEGHGYAKKPNQDYMFYAVVEFAKRTLLK